MYIVMAVVVTFNRKNMLQKTIEAIISQTYRVKSLIIIDNDSTDGTEQLLDEKGYLTSENIIYRRLENNLGGAGGFYEGIKTAEQIGGDFFWLMDDDVIPEENSLQELVSAYQWIESERLNNPSMRKTAYLASAIYGPNGEFMNLPTISHRTAENGYEYWYRFLEKGVINIQAATFVSLLINGDAVKQCGLPCKDYFIWGDDGEYTLRLHKYFGDAYFIGKSRAVHNRVNAKKLDINNENDPERMKIFHYYYRNNAINSKYYNGTNITRSYIKALIRYFKNISNSDQRNRIKICLQGYREAIFTYKQTAEYIQSQIKMMN